jgi:hypothetical protein
MTDFFLLLELLCTADARKSEIWAHTRGPGVEPGPPLAIGVMLCHEPSAAGKSPRQIQSFFFFPRE